MKIGVRLKKFVKSNHMINIKAVSGFAANASLTQKLFNRAVPQSQLYFMSRSVILKPFDLYTEHNLWIYSTNN